MGRQSRSVGRYGPWALVAGASQGLGEAFAETLAAEGYNLVLVARRGQVLEAVAGRLQDRYPAEVRCLVCDLADADTAGRIERETRDIDVGLLVYNAAYAPVGPFASLRLEEARSVIDVNVRAPVELIHLLLPRFCSRDRAGIVLMSSLSGDQGSPNIAAYGASKAFATVFAEGLWHELRAEGVDVTACVAGAIRTPGLAEARKPGRRDAPGTLEAAVVARRALGALGKRPVSVPGAVNRIARLVMGRLLPERASIGIMAGSTNRLTEEGRSNG